MERGPHSRCAPAASQGSDAPWLLARPRRRRSWGGAGRDARPQRGDRDQRGGDARQQGKGSEGEGSKGSGEAETLPVSEMVTELIEWDEFFNRFKSAGKTGVRFKKAEFVNWMKKHFPDFKKVDHGDYPYFKGLKRKRA